MVHSTDMMGNDFLRQSQEEFLNSLNFAQSPCLAAAHSINLSELWMSSTEETDCDEEYKIITQSGLQNYDRNIRNY